MSIIIKIFLLAYLLVIVFLSILSVLWAMSLIFAPGCGHDKDQEVTFKELLANPSEYDGKGITIVGFYFQGFEVSVIAENLEYSGYAEGHLVPKSEMVWIEGGIPREIFNSLYLQSMMGPEERYGKVRVTGTFEYGEKYGHLGGYNSQIIPSDVVLLEWSRPAPQ